MVDNLLLPKEEGWDYGSIFPLRTETGGIVPASQFGGVVNYLLNHAALPDFVRDPINQLTGMMAKANEPQTVDDDPNNANLRPGTGADLAAVVGLGIGGSAAFGRVPKGAFGVFGGPGAKTADLDKLSRAQWLDKNLQGQDKIWNETGWFKDADGKWKFEIPDSGAKWTTNAPTNEYNPKLLAFKSSTPSKLGDVLHHPELYKAYPELADTPVQGLGMAGLEGMQGAVYDTGQIGLRGGQPNEVLSTLIHELDHKVQNSEGFAAGGNMSNFLPEGFDKTMYPLQKARDDVVEELREKGVNMSAVSTYLQSLGTDKELHYLNAYPKAEFDKAHATGLLPKWVEALEKLKPYEDMRQDAFDKYLSLAGEVSARNAQERLAQQDYTSHPHKTTGYPTGDQLVQFRKVNHDPFSLSPVDHDPFNLGAK